MSYLIYSADIKAFQCKLITMNAYYYRPVIFNLLCMLILFAPAIGDFRWIGLVGAIYIGLPWYILATKDHLEHQNKNKTSHKRVYSPTLLIVGAISSIFGVAIDLYIIYEIANNPSNINVIAGVTRLLFGLPFLGFGIYLISLSLGISNDK